MAIRIIDFAVGFQTDQVPDSAVAADTIAVTPTGNLGATNTQAALVELQGDIDGLNTDVDALLIDIADLESADTELGSDIADLQAADLLLAADIEALQAADTATASALALKVDETGGTASALNILDFIEFDDASTPATPAAGKRRFYPKSDGKFYQKDSTGLEKQAGGSSSGSGEINLILSPSESTNWVGTATVATDTTASNFPLQGALETALKVSSAVSGQYREYAFTVPSALARKLKIELWYKHSGSATDWKVELYKGGVKQTLKTDVSGNSYLTAGTGRFNTDFDFEAASYTLRLVRAASVSMDLYVQGVVVGPGLTASGAIVGDWAAFTPTTNNTGSKVFTNTGMWRRVGSDMELKVFLNGNATAAGVSGASFNFEIPTGYNLDTSKDLAGNDTFGSAGSYGLVGSAQYDRQILMGRSGSRTISFLKPGTALTYTTTDLNVGNSVFFVAHAMVPIAEWAGNGTVNLGAGAQPEYASNSSTTSSSDSASFATGSQGSLVPTITATLGTSRADKTVQFSTPFQSDDMFIVEFQNAGVGPWLAAGDTPNYDKFHGENSNRIGVGIIATNPTLRTVTVGFAIGGAAGSGGYGTVGLSYPVGAGDRWRVRKVSASSPVGFGKANSSETGLVAPRKGQTALTVTGTNWTTGRAVGIYYQDQDGNHRLKFNISGSVTAATRTSIVLTANVVFKNVTDYFQSVSALTVPVLPVAANCGPGTGTLGLAHASASTTSYHVSGDVELESKPSWA